MKNFKKLWEIKANWQLIFPFLGILGLIYSSYKIVNLFAIESLVLLIICNVIGTYLLLKLTLFFFKKLENKWGLKYRWEMIRVFLIFAITGSSSVFIGKPIFKLIGITKENLQPVLYWILYVLISFAFYQILLVLFGWLFGQHKFFWEFEKKMLRRMGLGFVLNEKQE